MQKDDPLAEAELTFLLGMAFQLILTDFNSRLAAAGYSDLRPIHGMAFQILRHGGATSSELAERLGITKQAAGQIVEDLEGRGYLQRLQHPDGGRRRLVVLTGKAEDHLRTAGAALHALEHQLGRRLGDASIKQLRIDLARIVRELGGDAPPPLRPVW